MPENPNKQNSFLCQPSWIIYYHIYLTQSSGNKRAYAFPKCISLKVNVRAQMKFELVYYHIAIQYVNHDTMRTIYLSIYLSVYLH